VWQIGGHYQGGILLSRPLGAFALLADEDNGFAIDATTEDGTVSVKDVSTPGNNRNNNSINSSNLTQAGTSIKYVLWNDGTVRIVGVGAVAQQYNTTLSKFGILIEPAATNLALYSNDFTQAATWVAVNMTAALTATGPTGVSNSASTLTASAGNATILQSIVSGSSARLTAVWIKRRTGVGNIDLTQNNGGTWATQSVTGSWTRFPLSAVTSTDPVVGIRIVTSGDEVDVWGFQHETGSTVTSTIPTAGTTVTRAIDNVSVLTSTIPYSATAGTVYVDTSRLYAAASSPNAFPKYWQMDDGTNNEAVFTQLDAVGVQEESELNDGGVSQFNGQLGSAVAANTRLQITYAWADDDLDAVLNGGTVQTDTAITALPAAATVLHIGDRATADRTLLGYIYRLVYVPRQVETQDNNIETWRYNYP
jgi:hypothetical protein